MFLINFYILIWRYIWILIELSISQTELGTLMLENGAETYRVEETMSRICLAYGIEKLMFCNSYKHNNNNKNI